MTEQKLLKVVAFDCNGEKVTDYLPSGLSVSRFLARHGLEMFSAQVVTQSQMEAEQKALFSEGSEKE